MTNIEDEALRRRRELRRNGYPNITNLHIDTTQGKEVPKIKPQIFCPCGKLFTHKYSSFCLECRPVKYKLRAKTIK